MKERRKNIQKFTLLSDDIKMNESTAISQKVPTTSGDEGFEEPPADRKDESTRSTSDRTTQSSTRTESSETSVNKSTTKPMRSVPAKKRTKEKQLQEAVIIPRRRKSRQLPPSRTSSRTSINDIQIGVEADGRKCSERKGRRTTPNTKERVMARESCSQSPESMELNCNAMNDVTANRDRIFGGEPEPKPRKAGRRRRRPKPDDNSSRNVYWWVGTSEDDEPPVIQKPNRATTAQSSHSGVQQIFSGSQESSETKILPIGHRRLSYKLRDDDTSAKLFGIPEVKKQLTKTRPGDASYNRLFGSDSDTLPLTPRTNTSNGHFKTPDLTRERLFGEKMANTSRPLAKHFPDKLAHENIFAPSESNHEVKRTSKAAILRNPIVGDAVLPARTRRDSGIPSSNPITGEGYRPVKRDIHAVTCRI